MLINNLETLKRIIPTVQGGEFARYSTYMETADQYLIGELIGQKLYDKVTGVSHDEKLLGYCENIAALKGYMDAIPFLDLVETETGFGVVSSGDGSTVPASKDRVASLAKGLETRLSSVTELLLEYLEGNSDFYDDWKEAKAYTVNHDSYIFTLTQFRRYARYDGSRLEWLKELAKITRAIRLKIEPVISQALSAAIIKQLQDNTLSPANKKIIEDLRFSLAAFVTGDDETGRNCLYRANNTILADIDSYTEYKGSTIYAAYLASTSGFSVDQSIASFGI